MFYAIKTKRPKFKNLPKQIKTDLIELLKPKYL